MKAIKVVQFSLLFGVLFLLSSVGTAKAGVYLESTFLPSYSQSNTGIGALGGSFDTATVNPESGFSYDLRNTLGWVFGPHFLVGFSYNYANSPLKRSATADATSLDRKTTNSEFGPTVGYFSGNLRFMVTYIMAGSKKRTETQVMSDGTKAADYTMENKGASGYQIAVGYSFPISKTLKIGPTLIYRSVQYSKQSLSNALDPSSNYSDRSFATKATESNLLPMITLALTF